MEDYSGRKMDLVQGKFSDQNRDLKKKSPNLQVLFWRKFIHSEMAKCIEHK